MLGTLPAPDNPDHRVEARIHRVPPGAPSPPFDHRMIAAHDPARRARIFGALLIPLLLGAAPPARACAPAKAQMVGIMSFYEGTIGHHLVRMGLQFAPGGQVLGRYGYAASPGRLALRGRLDGGSRLTLRETSAGKPTGRITARMPGTGDAACQTITGQWVAASGGKPLPVRLRYSDTSMHPLGWYLRPATLAVERAAVAFRAAALAGNRRAVLAALRYPVRATLGGKSMLLANPRAVAAHYAAIFRPAYLARLRADVPHMMFVRDEGFMLGGGAVWFDRDGKVITLND